ncbi:PHD finger protein 13-like [Pomacea canaliculata]|uniref:PHD finger protein 13-like n=1 Tax=Pomacea canaliculata TaxID=400727 RepID=UPI000D72C9AC|nr:PHD finger protein 13-like [Pomacea canaliculata]
MDETEYTGHAIKRTGSQTPEYEFAEANTSLKRPRTKEDFMAFCCTVLAYTQYEQYEELSQEGMRQDNNMSPLDTDSGSNSSENLSDLSSCTASDSEPSPNSTACTDAGDDIDSITCYCMKPFANRPMIECDECQLWIHLSCAKIRRTNIPKNFVCQPCRDAKYTVRKSDRQRTIKKR